MLRPDLPPSQDLDTALAAAATVRRRAREAGIKTKIGCHTFRATGITALPEKRRQTGSSPEDCRSRCESSHTTGPYDRRDDEISLDEVERIAI